MQLFFLQNDYQLQGQEIVITESRTVHQANRVLRMKIGDGFMIQYCADLSTVRLTCSIQSISSSSIVAKIHSTDYKSHQGDNSTYNVCIALPNRFEKIELIVQKLTEIQVSQIIFFTSARSIIKAITPQRQQRITTIAVEAVEQSYGRSVPKIHYYSTLSHILDNNAGSLHILCDREGTDNENHYEENINSIYLYIGPEGGFTKEEKDRIKKQEISKTISLGDTNLRMETAAIISSRRIQHTYNNK